MSLTAHAFPMLFTVLLWWFSTGVILYLDGLASRTYRWSMAASTIVLVIALHLLRMTAGEVSVRAAYCAFTGAILVWGWIEMSFLMGFITGARKSGCPAGAGGWRRAALAFETIAHHELALLAGAALIAVATWNGANQLGLWTFGVLWISRQSTKLNLFLGARNLSEEFLPDHLRYLHTYFNRRPMNLLFPISVTAGTIAAALLWRAALSPAASQVHAIELTFMGVLVTLAVLEHWFLILPIQFNALWNWGLGSRRNAESSATDGSNTRKRVAEVGVS